MTAAEVVQKQIETDTPPIKHPEADKFIVTPQEQKVYVYRMNFSLLALGVTGGQHHLYALKLLNRRIPKGNARIRIWQ